MERLMHQNSSGYAAMVIVTLALLLCPGTGLLLNDTSLISGSSNGSDIFVLASESLATQTHSKQLEKYPPSNANKTSLKDQDLCSTREKLRTSTEIRNLSILMTNEEDSMKQSRLAPDMIQRKDFPTDAQGLDFDNGNRTQEPRLTNLLVTNGSINSLSVVSEIWSPNQISGTSTEELNDTFRPSKRPCSNVTKHFPMLMPGKFLIPPYSKTKIDFTVKVKGNDEYETDYDNSEISASKQEHSTKNDTDYYKHEMSKSIQEHSLNNNLTENETVYESTEISRSIQEDSLKIEISTSVQEYSLNNNVTENETDYDNTEISASKQENNRNNNVTENETDYDNTEISVQEHGLRNSCFNTDQETDTAIPIFNDIVDDTDEALTFTCKGRCGENFSFPCSCSATCVIYDTCCDNLTQDCPHIWYEGRTRFGHISRADLICDEDLLYKVVSCPKPVKENVEKSEIVSPKTNKPLREKGNKIITTKKWFPFGVQTSPGTGDVTRSSSPRSSATDVDSQETVIQRLYKALSHAPITDSNTGLTFLNKAIYDCNNMSETTALRWSLVLDYALVNPTKLEDFYHKETLIKYEPDFDERIFKAHLCIPNVIETCDHTEKFQGPDIMHAENCPKSTTFVSSGEHLYRNRFCAYCNEGRKNRYALVSWYNVQFKGPDFHVLMSMSDSKTFSFKVSKPPYFVAKAMKLAWSFVSCSVPDQDISPRGTTDPAVWETENQSVCSVRCEDPSFTVRSDGLCKAEHHALLAVADDGLSPLCPSSVEGLAKFLSCGLQSRVESLRYADFSAPSASTMFDATHNRILYIVKLHMALPQTSNHFLSHARDDSFKNIHHIALLARSFKDYRLSQTLCSQTKDVTEKNDLKVIHTGSLVNTVSFMNVGRGLSEGMEKLRGQTLDNETTTTVCLGSLYSDHEADPNNLDCMDDRVYERDATLIRKFRNTSCFAHLENLESAESNRATGKESRSVLLLCVLCLNVLFISIVDPQNIKCSCLMCVVEHTSLYIISKIMVFPICH